MVETKCLIPDCNATVIHGRGLCRPCYTFATVLTRLKIASWKDLEKAGVVLSTTGRHRAPARHSRLAWFAKATGDTPESLLSLIRERKASA